HVRVLVARVAGMPADPAPLDVVALGGVDEAAPEVLVLDAPRLPPPASRPPGRDPLSHALHEVLRVGDEHDAAGHAQGAQPLDRAADRHAVVGRRGFADPVVAPDPGAIRPELDQAGGAAACGPVLEPHAQTGCRRVDVDRGLVGDIHARFTGTVPRVPATAAGAGAGANIRGDGLRRNPVRGGARPGAGAGSA